MTSSTDRIEKTIQINAPRARVWRALSNAEEFGRWFGASLKGQAFAVGQRAQGPITTAGYEHLMFDVVIETMELEKRLSFRWPIDPKPDYSREDCTLVTFELTDSAGGTLLKVVESGFDGVPPARRLEAFRENSAGWEVQLKNVAAHATQA
jgi:uncharacterized protein YndB with AHSA1/START domain